MWKLPGNSSCSVQDLQAAEPQNPMPNMTPRRHVQRQVGRVLAQVLCTKLCTKLQFKEEIIRNPFGRALAIIIVFLSPVYHFLGVLIENPSHAGNVAGQTMQTVYSIQYQHMLVQ